MAEPKINKHVTRMNRHLPFSPKHDQIYEEYQNDSDTLDIETKALNYLLKAVRGGAKLIILTGDAGHGKTHLCRRLIQEYLGYDKPGEARKILLEQCDGTKKIGPSNSSEEKLSLIIHKDFSELDISIAAQFLDSISIDSNKTTTVICANEGRLRAVIAASKNSAISEEIYKVFNKSFETGLCALNENLHIINLNYQSIAGADLQQKSILHTTIKEWAQDSRRWKESCGSCSLNGSCPIYKNKCLLSDEPLSDLRLQKLEKLFVTAERLGCVVTVREALMTVAYLLTGGLTCSDVHILCGRNKSDGWQHEYIFYNLLFSPPKKISIDRLIKGIPVLSYLLRLDPGKNANRNVDDRILNETGVFEPLELDLLFKIYVDSKEKIIDASNGIDDINFNPVNRKERQNESEKISLIVSALRRRTFFDDSIEHGSTIERLSFEFGDIFEEILENKLSPKKSLECKGLILSGLHMLQGLRLSSRETRLYLVDPAFGRATSEAAIISRAISSNNIKLLPMADAWNIDASKKDSSLKASVNWLDRYIIIRIDNEDGSFDDLTLDLMGFECVAKASTGYIAEEFYSHDIRRIRNFLGKIAERADSINSRIDLFMDGKMSSISLDANMIQVDGGGA